MQTSHASLWLLATSPKPLTSKSSFELVSMSTLSIHFEIPTSPKHRNCPFGLVTEILFGTDCYATSGIQPKSLKHKAITPDSNKTTEVNHVNHLTMVRGHSICIKIYSVCISEYLSKRNKVT